MATSTAEIQAEYRKRAEALRDAEAKAVSLFEEIEKDYVRSGISEKQLSDEIRKLGQERHGVRTHWHKRVVRSGFNTLEPFKENPPDRMIEPGDILYVDLGPVFEQWEADFGRTFVLPGGSYDPYKEKLRDSLEPCWQKIQLIYRDNPDMTGEELYELAGGVAKDAGYEWGADLAGHIVGAFPHERIPDDMLPLYIKPGNKQPMSSLGKDGHRRHWILEVHLWDKEREMKGFYEQLLTIE